MHSSRQLSAFLLLATALACGGKVRPIPDGALLDEEDSGGEQGGQGAGSSGSSGSSGSPGRSASSSGAATASSSSGGSSSGSETTCGGVLCNSSEICCVSTAMGGDATSGGETCMRAAACTGLALACGDATDCSGKDVCCIAFNIESVLGGGTVTGSSSCKATCPTGPGNGQLCSTSTECPQGVTCQSTDMGGSVCGGINSLLGGL